jgi:Phage integrase family
MAWFPVGMARICEAARLLRITPNELRHTCATQLNDDGVPLELIADMLGHTTTQMLQRHYRHRVRPSADAAVRTIDEMFGGNDQPASSVSRERMNSAKASAETSRREPRRKERSSPDRR